MQLKRLTEDQIKLIPVHQREWFDIAFSTDPANRNRAENAISEIYSILKLNQPKFVWVDNPCQDKKKGYDLSQIDYRFSDFWTNYCHYFEGLSLPSNYSSLVYQENLHEILCFTLGFFETFIEDSLANKVKDHGGEYHFGNRNTPVISYLNFFKRIGHKFNDKDSIKIDLLTEIAQSCWEWYPQKELCIICERPEAYHVDFQYETLDIQGKSVQYKVPLLHEIGKPALEFRDGLSLYSVFGVNVPEKWGKTLEDQWSAEWLLEAKNAEHKMILIKVLGYEKVLEELNSTLIHRELDKFKHEMMLFKIKDYDVEPIHLLKVVCPSTNKIHVLRVPPYMKTCEEARRWTLFDVKNQFDILEEA